MTDYYVDNVSGSNSNNGTASGTPKLTWQAIHDLGLTPGSDTVYFVSDGTTAYVVPNSLHELILNASTSGHTVPYNASSEYEFPANSISVGGGGGTGLLAGGLIKSNLVG